MSLRPTKQVGKKHRLSFELVSPANLKASAIRSWMLIFFVKEVSEKEWSYFVLEIRTMKKKKEGEESPTEEKGTHQASCSGLLNSPRVSFGLVSPHYLLPPPALTDWRKWMSTNWPRWWGEGDSGTTPALRSNRLSCGLCPASVSSIKLASENSLFGCIAHYGLCVYIGQGKSLH